MNTKIGSKIKILAFLLAAATTQQSAWAVFKYTGCDDLTDSVFQNVNLVTQSNSGINEPIKMALDADAAGNVDIYWVERHGGVKRYNGAAKTVDSLATIFVADEFESGLTGIALDPNFKNNHWIYLYYTYGGASGAKKPGSTGYWFRLSRFTLGANNKLNTSSEIVLLSIPAYYRESHTGGAMRFDESGNLYITTGENGASVEGTANTNDLRGKVLRIKPKAIPEGTALTSSGLGVTYDIPTGNLYPEGTAKTRPEVYVMGARNPYSISLDPIRKAVMWGDVGPDGTGVTEEHNITSVPGYFGYPYFAGVNKNISGTQTAATPIVDTNVNLGLPKHTGLRELKPAIPAVNAYNQAAAITGPLYRYHGQLKSTMKMPPHFEGIWFVSDFSDSWVEALTLDAAGLNVVAREKVFTKLHFYKPIDIQTGPDGAMYFINYGGYFSANANTSISRVEYKGKCLPALAEGISQSTNLQHEFMHINGLNVTVTGSGSHQIVVMNLQGQTLKEFKGKGAANYNLATLAKSGIYFIKIISEHGSFTEKIFKP